MRCTGFSTLQRVEIAEMDRPRLVQDDLHRFSTLQRVEIAEMSGSARRGTRAGGRFSTLQRVEIAEIDAALRTALVSDAFQYSSTSRNC